MRACLTLFRFLSPFLPAQPTPRLKTMFAALEAVVRGERLSLTGIARNLRGPAYVKHKIKRIYRFLSNPLFHAELNALFRAIAGLLITPQHRPLILVDWTKYGPHHYALVAAIRHDGRALPIYVEIHPIAHHNSPDTEHPFLDTLKRDILPPGTRPILVTDAGFRNPWFYHVQSLGWDAVGRLVSYAYVQSKQATCDIWTQLQLLQPAAANQPEDQGLWWVTKTNPYALRLVLYRGTATRQTSQARGPTKKARPKAAMYRRRAAEPWRLATTLREVPATQIVAWYAQRMQIEETFRDDKNRDTGLGLDSARSVKPQALRALRLLGALASLWTQLVGLVGEKLGLHRRYQSNTVSDRRVLSLTVLGRQILKQGDLRILSVKRLTRALEQIQKAASASFICGRDSSS